MKRTRCHKCKLLSPVTFDKIVNRRRRVLCTPCAREEGWFRPESVYSDNVQLKLDIPEE